jgi:acetyl-CoA synthase
MTAKKQKEKPKKEVKTEFSMDKVLNDLTVLACDSGIDTTMIRTANMQPQCGFGDLGLCCRICLQGPCRINPFGDEPSVGICGARDYTIVARNIIRMMAAGCAAHSDHGRHIAHTIHGLTEGHAPDYKLKDTVKLKLLAKGLGISTDGKDDMAIAKELTDAVYNDFMSQSDDPCKFFDLLFPESFKKLADFNDVTPTNIDRGICEVMHRTHIGCDADPVPLIFGGIKCALGDITGEFISTCVSDVLFGTPSIVKSEANLGVLSEDQVNIVMHGHNPILSEVIVDVADEMAGEAKKAGASDGIGISGICCTANELLMRRGIPIATNFLGQDLAILTGLVDAMVVDYQCIMPAVSVVAQCYHTTLISTQPITRIPGDVHIEFNEKTAKQSAREIIRLAIEAYKKRDKSKIRKAKLKQKVVAGFSVETIKDLLSKLGEGDPLDHLVEAIKSGEVQGLGLLAGCNNQKLHHDTCHVTVAVELLKNDVLILATGCAAQAYTKHGLLSPEATEKYAGPGLKKFLTALAKANGLDEPLPPVWHMGSCVDNSRPELLASELADKFGCEMGQLPIVASAPEAMSEKAVVIGTWTVATGWPTHVGVFPYIKGSPLVNEIAERTAKDVYGGFFIWEPDPVKGAEKLNNILKWRRWRLHLGPDPVHSDCYGNPIEGAPKLTQKELFKKAIDGAIIATGYADILLNHAIKKYGADKEIAYPDTGYGLPCIDAWSGVEVKKLKDLPPLLGEVRGRIVEKYTYENAVAAGEAVLYSAEIVEALKYLEPGDPYENKRPYTGFVPDPILRKLGIAFVDDTIPAAAVFVGKARDPKGLAKMVYECQEKGMLIIATFDIIHQLMDEGYKFDESNKYGLDVMLYPVGEFTQAIHGASFATRAAMAFGGIKRGDREGMYNYLKRRPRAFVIQLGPIDDIKAGAEFGVLFMGSPTITDQDIEEIPDKYVMEKDYDQMIKRAMEVRDIKVKLKKLPIPVLFGPSFEGESIRKKEMYFEAGGTRTKALEYVRMVENKDEVNDGEITVIGPDVDKIEEGGRVPLGIFVDVYGRKMQKDFESVFERRIHQFFNFVEGGWHTGQRNMIWVRLSKSSVAKGLKLKDFGTVLHAKFHDDFGGIVDRVQVTIVTEEAELEKRSKAAMEAYTERDARIKDLTDEAVDTYYSCTLCQSFAPDHLCIITPERLGLCGAINWLDAKASNEITPEGPNQPWPKGNTLDEEYGIWDGVNKAVSDLSRGKLQSFSAYSLIRDPMTSCGCFECIVAIEPMTNGVIVVNREYPGETPIGMKFSTLAGSVGGGNQVPGFSGIGRQFITSKKFIRADGGFERIVWMPKQLKEDLKEAMTARAKELGKPDFVDKIADETNATTAEELLAWVDKVDHPVKKMKPLM